MKKQKRRFSYVFLRGSKKERSIDSKVYKTKEETSRKRKRKEEVKALSFIYIEKVMLCTVIKPYGIRKIRKIIFLYGRYNV